MGVVEFKETIKDARKKLEASVAPASSHQNSSSKGSSGQGMGKIVEIFGVEPDKSQK